MKEGYEIGLYNYDLPKEFIASEPAQPRDSSKLLVLDRKIGAIQDKIFRDLPDFLREGDVIVVNDTKVFPARLLGKKVSGGNAEIFLLERLENGDWTALVKPGKRLGDGAIVNIGEDFSAIIREKLSDRRRRVSLLGESDIWSLLERHGHTPLPVYIDRKDRPDDIDRYQTVYAEKIGAVAAPTAGFHFTENLIKRIEQMGVKFVNVTLHVGWGTFKGIEAQDIRNHKMHSEYYEIPESTALEVNHAKSENRRVICVGTTSVRAIESAAGKGLPLQPHSARTELFISPGYEFKVADGMITNFHLPRSSLIVMVSAFAGRESIMAAYRHAIASGYRFYSYGDAMLVV